MKKIYVAIALNGKVSWTQRLDFLELVSKISRRLHDDRFEIINLNTSGVLECPDAGFFDCVRFADKVVCLCDEASCGFGSTVWSIMQRLLRPGFAFIQGDVPNRSLDLSCLPDHPLVTRVTFQNFNDISMSL